MLRTDTPQAAQAAAAVDPRHESLTHGFHRRARAMLRDLAGFEADGLPVVSAYLDLQPSRDAQHPESRETTVVLRDRLGEIDGSLPNHGREHDSFAAGVERAGDVGLGVERRHPAAGDGVNVRLAPALRLLWDRQPRNTPTSL